MTRYDVRQAAKALFDLGAANGGDPGTFDRDSAEIRAYLDRVFDKAWQSSPIRAALASGERGVTKDKSHPGITITLRATTDADKRGPSRA